MNKEKLYIRLVKKLLKLGFTAKSISGYSGLTEYTFSRLLNKKK